MTRGGLDTLVPTTAAARLAGVSTSVVRQWAARGHLVPTSRTASGRPLYRAGDVLEVERDTRRRDDSTRAVASRVLHPR